MGTTFPRAALIAWVIGNAACEPPPDPPPPPPPPPPTGLPLEIGTGASDGSAGFVTFDDGAELVLEPGSQGGFHVFINLRFDETVVGSVGTYPSVSRVARRIATGQLVSRADVKVRIIGDGPGRFVSENSMRLFLCPTPIGIPVADEEIELEIRVKGEGGSEAVGTIRFLPRCPVGAQAEFCARICYG